ncbi:hypothetical protein HanXRQr2_Chr15g0706991 [Helianthus annuus]|uniref:Uncharacterized protein n=1 Tax=Helianthus annuus TaxID=4232 RepID=A0A9K3E255_HELAN|nr:hypothetical protein HanXRQr2_Chr15g0706991 [Helianthus annuus]KAJ0474103.1 hypothetical protein HanHA89_Chr15g0625901 [Helianthus annuus]
MPAQRKHIARGEGTCDQSASASYCTGRSPRCAIVQKTRSTDDNDVWTINVRHNRISHPPPPTTDDDETRTFRNQHVANYGARPYLYLYGH